MHGIVRSSLCEGDDGRVKIEPPLEKERQTIAIEIDAIDAESTRHALFRLDVPEDEAIEWIGRFEWRQQRSDGRFGIGGVDQDEDGLLHGVGPHRMRQFQNLQKHKGTSIAHVTS